ncbi:SCP-like protein [Oesophagostomum dentatum]|uniref:SCP-like protein n=1 Tax=Oesophagostomum dentatum TaxID=61180 RepID=A0A0B1TFY3_OESDE|nr:SCP-like protein [Oesophagostomum dentatum]
MQLLLFALALALVPLSYAEDGTNTICSTSGMTDKIRTRILNIHNELRSLVARGLARNGTQGYAPKASAMYKLKYDCKLEELAMSHAKTCVYGHRPKSERPNIGENIYNLSVLGADRTMNGEWATADWFYELKRYGVFADNRFTDALNNRPNTVVGHYTQHMSCNVLRGNMKDQLIYDVGTPCSKCPPGTKCAADEGLCVFP